MRHDGHAAGAGAMPRAAQAAYPVLRQNQIRRACLETPAAVNRQIMVPENRDGLCQRPICL